MNAGVTAQQGFALQRNAALFILLDKYDDIYNGKNYFISLEHLEDILFCFLDSNEDIYYIDAHQIKKKSNDVWKVGKKLSDILFKLLETGINLLEDQYPKSTNYSHNLSFSTNKIMKLDYKYGNDNLIGSLIINELDSFSSFYSFHENLRNKIIKASSKSIIDKYEEQLKNLNFNYLTLTSTNKEQVNQLQGKLSELFGYKIKDTKAAIDTIMLLFKNVELVYHQKSIARLSDENKKITSLKIKEAMEIITTKSKAFDYWRSETPSVCKNLRIKPFERNSFELKFINAFDYFKSDDELEHRKIYDFVNKSYKNCVSFDESECVNELYMLYLNEKNTYLGEMALKAIIYASFFEVSLKMEN